MSSTPPKSPGPSNEVSNPWHGLVVDDLRNRSDWASTDQAILKRRLGERQKRRKKPYPGAPNFVVPVVDDTTREKTDQESSMVLNAPRRAHFVSLDGKMPSDLLRKAQLGFDTFLRYIVQDGPIMEEALDHKNARGFVTMKIDRVDDPRWGLRPNVTVMDLPDVIVPPATKDIQLAERICCVYRFSPGEFERIGRTSRWKNMESVKGKAKGEDSGEDSSGKHSTLGATKHLIGVTTDGESAKTIEVWEVYGYADEWVVTKGDAFYGDGRERFSVGRRFRMVFCPDAPDELLSLRPWAEVEIVGVNVSVKVPAVPAASGVSGGLGAIDAVLGKDRPWPFVQARFENRSRYYYDSRGIGMLCMDDQIGATAVMNAKHTMMDYFQLPLFTGAARGEQNCSFEPGSFLPENVHPVTPPSIPGSFDFTIDQFRRSAGRRAGAGGLHMYSEQVAQSRKVEKTATEIQEESARTSMVSTASVDRFNGPWQEVYMQLWEELRRMKYALPIIEADTFMGMVPEQVYEFRVLIIPAGNSKTLNPDVQFGRDARAWEFAVNMLAKMGVVLDSQEAALDILGNWDPVKVRRWVLDPGKAGAGGQMPVYVQLGELSMRLQQIEEMMGHVVQAVKAMGEDHVNGSGVGMPGGGGGGGGPVAGVRVPFVGRG